MPSREIGPSQVRLDISRHPFGGTRHARPQLPSREIGPSQVRLDISRHPFGGTTRARLLLPSREIGPAQVRLDISRNSPAEEISRQPSKPRGSREIEAVNTIIRISRLVIYGTAVSPLR
jgi:hypothetical protein